METSIFNDREALYEAVREVADCPVVDAGRGYASPSWLISPRGRLPVPSPGGRLKQRVVWPR
jgi:hypothetical protein